MSNVHFLREPEPANTEQQERRQNLFAQASEVSAKFARRGPELDRLGLPPRDEIEALRQAGLLSGLHAPEVGGAGLSWVDGLRLVRIVARGESSIGQLLGYHYVNSQYVYWAAADPRQAWVFGAETVSGSSTGALRSIRAIPAWC